MSDQTLNKRSVPWKSSIQTRLTGIIALMMVLILAVNLFINNRIDSMVRKIDQVFASNVSIVELTETLEALEGYVYEYLNTKSSAALENYYRFAEDYRDLAMQLNNRNVDNRVLMLEKNIRGMSMSFLEKAEETVQAKRGRNVERYKASYEEEELLYRYINDYIYELNSQQFLRNSENYQLLLSILQIMRILSIAAIIIIVLFSTFAIILTVRDMIAPLTALSDTAHQVAEGNLNVEVPVSNTMDEVGIVTRTFDQMLISIRAYVERVREGLQDQARLKERELSMEANLKEAQLKFLQAQINPHFLFNCLNAGAQLAVLEDADATGDFLEKMADFFRYNVKKTDGDSTLREEIELVDNYIYILNVRFAGDITYRKEIEDGIGEIKVPGMILQPLVENAVTHGIHDMMDHGEISLSVVQDEDEVRVTVSDNGKGMTKDQIARILNGQYEGDETDQSTGIGLANVMNRLRLFYNQDDLLSIYSEGAGLGTEIVMRLPVVEKEKKDAASEEEIEDVPGFDS
ncbi:MAG: histidine kinase [Lachnospiraceae bacterium]|nr:histidine kinase [Lachnospiraceae bacterium]